MEIKIKIKIIKQDNYQYIIDKDQLIQMKLNII